MGSSESVLWVGEPVARRDPITSEGRQSGARMSDLAAKNCNLWKRGQPPLAGDAIARLAAQLGGDWQVVDDHQLECTYEFANFVDALAFTNRIGELAEEQNHHPDIHLSWGKVKLVIWTHDADGLTENDFVWAAKADLRR